jgi:Protein of unknown function (DUF3295)
MVIGKVRKASAVKGKGKVREALQLNRHHQQQKEQKGRVALRAKVNSRVSGREREGAASQTWAILNVGAGRQKDAMSTKVSGPRDAVVNAICDVGVVDAATGKPLPPPSDLQQPQLPVGQEQQRKRRIVVASTSSEYETTDTETDDDSWASEDMSEGEVVMDVAENMTQDTDARITAITATSPAASKKKPKDPVRAAQQARQLVLEEAAMEAQRQRELFAKVPVPRSSSNLSGSTNNAAEGQLGGRTRSLLSLLMNPDPGIFPPGHPYRTSLSSGDFSQLRGNTGRGGNTGAGASAGGGVGGINTRVPPGLHASKSAAALPIATQASASGGATGNSSSSGYRPKGRPEGQEMEDDSESGEENADDSIQVSRSVAQRRLALLASGRRPMPTISNTTTVVANAVMVNINTNMGTDVDLTPRAHLQHSQQPPRRPVLPTIATAPIPLGHPYNLPAPAPPMTPRTTRRQMLQTELSESLRRNLLWERKVSNLGMRGTGGGGAGVGGARRQSSSGAISGGLRPLTSLNPGADERSGDREGGRVAAMARHRSWADDYHTSGW